MQLYAYPVIFFIFACNEGYGIVVKRSEYAEAFIYKGGAEVDVVVKGGISSTYPKLHNLTVSMVGPDMS